MSRLNVLAQPWFRTLRTAVTAPDRIEIALKYAAVLGFALLCGHAGWQLAQTVRGEEPHSMPATAPPPTLSASIKEPSAAQIARSVATQHWFGIAGSVDNSPTDAPVKTAGPVKVLGIIFAGDAPFSRAILALDGKQKSYDIGARLDNGDEVISIEADRVILTGGGKRYALVLKHPGSAMLAKAPHFNGGGAAGSTIARTRARVPASRPVAAAAPTVTGSTLQRLQALRAQLLSGSH